MFIIKIAPEENGAHASQKTNVPISVPGGWAVVPPELEQTAVSLLPWVILTVQGGVVASITDDTEAREAWQAEHPTTEPQPTAEEDRDAMLVDLEYRMTLLELGVN